MYTRTWLIKSILSNRIYLLNLILFRPDTLLSFFTYLLLFDFFFNVSFLLNKKYKIVDILVMSFHQQVVVFLVVVDKPNFQVFPSTGCCFALFVDLFLVVDVFLMSFHKQVFVLFFIVVVDLLFMSFHQKNVVFFFLLIYIYACHFIIKLFSCVLLI